VESIDVDYLRADYSLWDWMWHGRTELLKNLEVRNTRVVLDPAKASIEPKVPRPDERLRLFPVFPERLRIADANVLVRSTTEKPNFVLEHFELELDPKNPGALKAATLQLPTAEAWRNISAQTSYTNKNLVLSGVVLDQQNQIRLFAFDASHIAARSLEVVLDASLAGGTIAGSVALKETADSVNMKLRLVAENVSLGTLRGYIGAPENFPGGDAKRLTLGMRWHPGCATNLDGHGPGRNRELSGRDFGLRPSDAGGECARWHCHDLQRRGDERLEQDLIQGNRPASATHS
jgi:hypothetical protein